MSTPNSSSAPSRTSTPSHFTKPSETLEDALKTQTVGLVNLRDFQKRREELAEQRDREAAESNAIISGATRSSRETSVGSGGGGGGGGEGGEKKPARKKRKMAAVARGKLSFGGEVGDDGEEELDAGVAVNKKLKGVEAKSRSVSIEAGATGTEGEEETEGSASSTPAPVERKRKPNPNLKAPPPKTLTKSTLLREAKERELLRREFLQLQEKIKNEDISIPFVFYDGTNVPPPNNEPVTIKKGSPVWLFLERARRVSGRREWLRVSVDDLLLVRGDLIIPHHYEFYYFIANRTVGPNGILFDYPSPLDPNNTEGGAGSGGAGGGGEEAGKEGNKEGATKEKEGGEERAEDGKDEGKDGGKKMAEDPTLTKVVDRRWYERNKHIFPASIWTEYDPNADYKGMVRRDLGGNVFFFS